MTNVTEEKTKSRTLRIVSGATQICARVALLVALGGNDGNDLVDFVKRYADKVDLGVFDRQNGVFDFDGKNRQTKNVVNWGLGAVVWLVIGKVVSGVIRK